MSETIWYDVLPTPSGGVGLVMGDVAGKGLAAASMVGRLRSALRAYALEGHGPLALVERMNGYHAALGADLMTTMLYAVIEIDSGSIRIVNAGHPPPLVVRASGTVEPVACSGPLLGVIRSVEHEDVTVELHAGDALRFLEQTSEHFDIVFLDPPYGTDLLVEALARLPRVLKPGHRVYLEWPAKSKPRFPGNLHFLREKQAGQVSYGLATFAND